MKQPSIDILIPTYKPGPEFAMLLRRLACQRYPASQVIIINTEEQYWDPALEAEYPGCRVEHIRREEFDHGGTRRRDGGHVPGGSFSLHDPGRSSGG